jgi:beta-phosphoglucomutase
LKAKKIKNLKKYKAVLFDMDGVIVDSMPYHFISWFETLKKYKVTVSPFDIYENEGEKCEICVRRFFKRDNIKCDDKIIEQVLKLRDKLYKKYFKVHLFPDIEQVLNRLKKQGFLLAIVTGSNRDKVKSMLPKKIVSKFDVIIAADMIKRGKPYPDSYLTAAKQLKVKPGECIVIENAPYGIKAAKSAKMFCVTVTTSLPEQYLKQSDVVCKKVSDVL